MATPFTVYKLIILYMLRNSSTPVTNSEISQFILDREYTNYFHLQQALSELEETELIEKRTISNTSYYYLTDDGKIPSLILRMISLRISAGKSFSIWPSVEIPPNLR